MSKLYLVPTPIGNLEDITLRAIRILNEVDLIIAEDTRTSGVLLKHYQISTKMISYHKFNEHKAATNIIDILQQGQTVAMISDAGTPSISDPGYLLVKDCIDNNIDVECLPGASSILPAIAVSGLPNDRFVFEGFLPRKKGRKTRLQELATETRSIVILESPYRLVKTLSELAEVCGDDRKVSVSREISKMFEEHKRGSLTELISYFSQKTVKGEIVFVLEGFDKKSSKKENYTDLL